MVITKSIEFISESSLETPSNKLKQELLKQTKAQTISSSLT